MQQVTFTLDLTPENIAILCEVLPQFASGSIGTTTPETTESKAAPKAAPAAPKAKPTAKTESPAPTAETTAKEEPAEKKDAPAVSKTDVRAMALALSKAGKQDELKEIFAKYGAVKLSGVAEDDYPALMEDLVAANE